jgi:hypothetical protein
MKHLGSFRGFACLLATAAIAVLGSCGSETCGPCGTEVTRDTVEGLLDVFEESFGRRDLTLYDECLEDVYFYEFAEEDAESLGLASWEPFWGRMEDTSAVGSMLRDETVREIDVDLKELGRQYVEDNGDSVVVLTMATDISLTLQYPGSEPFIFLIRATRLEITAAPDPATEGLWVVRRMKEYYIPDVYRASGDRGTGRAGPVAAATAPTSFGMLKARFHEMSPRGTVGRLLETYFRSCEDRNIEIYGECLADYYRFIFVPDVANYLGLPPEAPWWGKTADVNAMANLFGSEDVISAEFDFLPVSCDTIVKNDSLIVRMRVWPNINVVVDEPGGEPIIFVVHETYLDFRFTPDPHFPDLDIWVMLDTEEIVPFPPTRATYASAASAGASSTYSMIKAVFHEP